MSDRVIIPLPGIGTLELPQSVFEQYLRKPEATITASSTKGEAAAELLTADQAAERFSLPSSWLLEKARQGAIPHRRIGRYVRFSPGELAEHLKRSPAVAVRSNGHR